MMHEEIRSRVLRAIANVAPEADLERVPNDVDIREELDLDSLDFTNYVIGLHEAFGIDIPEPDYRQLDTIAGAVDYLSERVGPGPARPTETTREPRVPDDR